MWGYNCTAEISGEIMLINRELGRPVAYSYVRFSTAKQELGDSLRRQVSLAEEYCKKHNLELHHTSYRDLGVSAFKSKNVEKGALSAFIAAVESGKVAPGSYLVIEQFDRLSREDVGKALKLVLDLVHAGIVIVTLDDERVWNKHTVSDLTNLIIAIVYMSRANNESVAKARRLQQAWAEKKRNAAANLTIMTRECPRWLTVNEDKSAFIVNEPKAESVRKVFDMKINGFGVVAIVRRANTEGWPVPGSGNTWHNSLVKRLLENRAVLGEYQPYSRIDEKRVPTGEPIPNFYPAILDENTFLRAQAAHDRKAVFPGRRDAHYRNFLQGMLKCSCGASLVRKNKQSSKQPGYALYYCTARVRGASKCKSIRTNLVESAVVHVVSTLASHFFNDSERVNQLKATADIQSVAIKAAQSKLERFADAVAADDSAIPILLERLKVAQSELDAAESALAATRAQLAELSYDSETIFENIAKAVRDVDSIDARAALREDLSRVLDHCIVYVEQGYAKVKLRGIDDFITTPLRIDDVAIPGLSIKAVEASEIITTIEATE